MTFSPFPPVADTLVVNARVLVMDAQFTDIADGALAVQDGRIAAIGPMAMAAHTRAACTIDAHGGLLLPGFVNTHCHAAMTLFRGLADDRPLDAFLQAVWAAEAAHLTPATVQAAATLGAAEMALGGVTHFTDMYWHPPATLAAARRLGLGISTGPVFVGFPGVDNLPWERRLADAEAFIDAQAGDDGVQLMLMPHSTYTLDGAQLRAVAALARRRGLRVHSHAAEAQAELQQVHAAHGTTPVQAFERTGLLETGALLAHAVHLDDADIALLAATGTAVAHCPASNAKLGSGIAPLQALRRAGVVVGMGTDGPASGNDLDMWKAMRLAASLHTLSTGDCGTLPARELVAMATRGGAAALGLARRKGTLALGMDADFMVVDVRRPHMVPLYDPYSALVYSAGRADVQHVAVQGRAVVTQGALCTPIDDAIQQVAAAARRIQPPQASA